ncbi:MAG: UDP-N-acetylmuramoyl-L-alanyl-D-glutamate--2,6-diaminopimelate ligase [Patescibacteria group bacterium]
MFKRLIKKILPAVVIRWYHLLLATLANSYYGRPSHWLVVIGVTGTNGKSTTVEMISQLLRAGGNKVGHIATTTIRVGDEEWLNKSKMTMLGRFSLQRMLKKMVQAKCQYAVIEVTSQGLEQYRGRGIEFDTAVITNLAPEHIEAHGSFANYAQAKEILFSMVSKRAPKKVDGKSIQTNTVINLDDKEVARYAKYPATKRFGITTKGQPAIVEGQSVMAANEITQTASGSQFKIESIPFDLPLLGEYNVANALSAICVGLSQGYKLNQLADWLSQIEPSPGRLEWIAEGQPFRVLIDQAPEPISLSKVFETIKTIKKERVIHVFGSAGGGRDKARRPVLGRLSVDNTDISIITNEDPYDEDPIEIMRQIAEGVRAAGAVDNQNMFVIPDRREAIKKALSLARPNDLVLITGKGSEQAIVVKNNKKIPWDDRAVVRELIKEFR